MFILHDGYNEFGRGETREEAIADAIASCPPQEMGDGTYVVVTESWIQEQLKIGAASNVYGTGLVLEELDDEENE